MCAKCFHLKCYLLLRNRATLWTCSLVPPSLLMLMCGRYLMILACLHSSAALFTLLHVRFIGASVSEPHLGSSTRPLSVSLSVCLSISYVRHFWSRGPRATRKRKPAHLKFKGHMHACCIILYVANASRAITTLIERLHMYSSSLITSSAG